MDNPNEKHEIIELALQQAIGGGGQAVDKCKQTCSFWGVDICEVDMCGTDGLK